jgi:hypothetical protein
VVGAILTFAIDATASGFNLNTVGIILMVGGLLGLLVSALVWSSFSPWSRRRTVAGGDRWLKSVGSSESSSDLKTPQGAVRSGLRSHSRPTLHRYRPVKRRIAMPTPSVEQVRGWWGRVMVDRDGNRLGEIIDIYLDRETDRPEWAVVRTGL